MKARTLLTGFILSLLVASCASGKKQLEQGNYHQALNLALSRLQNNPQHQKALETLIKSYPLAVRFYRGQIDRNRASHNPLKWEWMLADYHDLNLIYEAVQRSPAALAVIHDAANYYQEMDHTRARAAAARYRLGLDALQSESKQDARIAFDHLQICNEIIPGYKDVMARMREAREKGTVKVLVDLEPVPNRYYQISGEYFSDAVRKFLYGYQQSRFVEFSFSEDPQSGTEFDHLLKLRFEDFEVGHMHVFHRQKEVYRDSVVVGYVTLEDGSRKDVYNTVKAELNIFRKEVQSQGLLSMRLLDAHSGALLHWDEFPGSYQWLWEWGYYHGDERALDHEMKALCNRREQLPPPPQAMFVEFTKPIHLKVTKTIDRLYGEYAI